MTELTDFQRKTEEIYPEISLRFWEPLEKHTSFRIGGPAEVMAFPKNPEQLGLLLNKSALLDCKPVILGAGTNVLAPDEGVRGLVEKLPEKLRQAAKAREANPEASLSELAAMMEPPITKPAMNHRLQRIVQLAKEAAQ